jgi:hypothetical protein
MIPRWNGQGHKETIGPQDGSGVSIDPSMPSGETGFIENHVTRPGKISTPRSPATLEAVETLKGKRIQEPLLGLK